MSILLNTVSIRFSSAPSSLSTLRVVRVCSKASGFETSTTCIKKSDKTDSSRVALNASTNLCGSFLTNPTVSVSNTAEPLGKSNRRVVGSSVAKSLSSERSVELVSRLISEDFPALVYPTIAAHGNGMRCLRLRWVARTVRTRASISLRRAILARIWRRSSSSWLSPPPRCVTPPPRCLSKWLHARLRRGSEYSSFASSTCKRASFVRALAAKISRITSCLVTISIEDFSSQLRCWTGVSSSSKIIVDAPAARASAMISPHFPSPATSAGL